MASKLRVGKVAAGIYREFHARFLQVAAELGFDRKSAELQCWTVAKVAALAGVSPEQLTKAHLDAGREQLIAATRGLHPDHPMRVRPVTTRLHGAEATLFHAGVIDTPPRKHHCNKSAERARGGPAAAASDVPGIHRADAPLTATSHDGPRRGGPAGVRRLADRPGARGRSGR